MLLCFIIIFFTIPNCYLFDNLNMWENNCYAAQRNIDCGHCELNVKKLLYLSSLFGLAICLITFKFHYFYLSSLLISSSPFFRSYTMIISFQLMISLNGCKAHAVDSYEEVSQRGCTKFTLVSNSQWYSCWYFPGKQSELSKVKTKYSILEW